MRRHDLDLTSLVSGAIFVAVGMFFMLDYEVEPRWLVALVLISLGLVGLLSSFNAGRGQEPDALYAAPFDQHVEADTQD